MATDIQFCTVHRIGYNTLLDATCPQCMLQRMAPAQSLDYDVVRQGPVDGLGTLLNPRTLQPVK